MDDAMRAGLTPAVLQIAGLYLLALYCSSVSFAQSLPDPTRPPQSIRPAVTNHGEPTNLPVLQSVLTSPTRSLAIINGKQVVPGEMVGTARLIKINSTSVVLQNGRTLQTLTLFSSNGPAGSAH